MTTLALDIANHLSTVDEVTDLVGSSTDFGPWIFEDRPYVTVESTGKSLIVVTEYNPMRSMPQFGTFSFSVVNIDIWADSTRNPDGSVNAFDADDKIKVLARPIIKELHTPDRQIRKFGSSLIFSGEFDVRGIDLNDVEDSEGTRMGRLTFEFMTEPAI